MNKIATVKGKDYFMYKMCYNGKLEYVFAARSERAAKIKVSRYCNSSATLYKAMGGISLCDEYGNEIAIYSPFFGIWTAPRAYANI